MVPGRPVRPVRTHEWEYMALVPTLPRDHGLSLLVSGPVVLLLLAILQGREAVEVPTDVGAEE